MTNIKTKFTNVGQIFTKTKFKAMFKYQRRKIFTDINETKIK